MMDLEDLGVSPTTIADLEATLLTDELLRANREDPDMEVYRLKAQEGHPSFAMVQDKYVTYRGRLVVPAYEDLRTKIIHEVHSRRTTAHPGRNKTRMLAAAQY